MLYWKTKNSMKDTPVYMSYGLDENIHLYNNTMRNIATALGVKYIDSISYLCTTDGCLTRDSVDGTNIASIDYGHLTIAAAENFINRISNEIFTNTKWILMQAYLSRYLPIKSNIIYLNVFSNSKNTFSIIIGWAKSFGWNSSR